MWMCDIGHYDIIMSMYAITHYDVIMTYAIHYTNFIESSMYAITHYDIIMSMYARTH